jgi:lipoprotein-anchoring transpeptidase ErfK/SrfK
MSEINRRALVANIALFSAAALVGGCTTVAETEAPGVDALPTYALMYGPVTTEPFPIPAVNVSRIDPRFLRQEVPYTAGEIPGTLIVDPGAHYLYYVLPGARALRYGVGVGREGFGWAGDATIDRKQEWPDWYPPVEMIERQPEIKAQLVELQGGQGVPGGLSNPLGARAHYLYQNGKDTLYRIHGTNEPHTIGTSVSSGCIRMINQDVIDLYARVPIGTKVKVLSSGVA